MNDGELRAKTERNEEDIKDLKEKVTEVPAYEDESYIKIRGKYKF